MNEVIIYYGHAEIIMYDKNGIENGRSKISLNRIEDCAKYRWWLHRSGYAYCKVRIGTKSDGTGKWKNMQLSRFIANTPDGLICDHINHDTLDNRDENLRNCTVQQNAFNMSKMNGNKIKGVRKIYNKWYARLKYDNKEHSRGGFDTKDEAIQARRDMELQFYGEFAINKEE